LRVIAGCLGLSQAVCGRDEIGERLLQGGGQREAEVQRRRHGGVLDPVDGLAVAADLLRKGELGQAE
jgi:hypothetical protein